MPLQRASKRIAENHDNQRIQELFENLDSSYARIKKDGFLPGSKQTTHRVDKDICGFYMERLEEALLDENFIMAEIVLRSLPRFINNHRIETWYANPAFPKDGGYHHNEAGKTKLEGLLTDAEQLRLAIGEYDIKRYGENKEDVQAVFNAIYEGIRKRVHEDIKLIEKNPQNTLDISNRFRSLESVLGNKEIDPNKIEKVAEEFEEYTTRMNYIVRLRRLEDEYTEGDDFEKKQAPAIRELRQKSEKLYVDLQILRVVNERYKHFLQTGHLNNDH